MAIIEGIKELAAKLKAKAAKAEGGTNVSVTVGYTAAYA